MDQSSQFVLSVWGKITEPHASITDHKKQLEAKLVSFMVLVMIFGVTLNLLFGTGLTIYSLIALLSGYALSRTKHYSIATYLIIGILLVSMLRSLLVNGDFGNFSIFTNIAWLSLSLVFASLLLSIRETILISGFHLIIIFLLAVFIPEINLKSIGVSVGYISVFSVLLILTMWQRNVLEMIRQEEIRKQATHDLLTGLPNRFLLHDRLDQAIARLERSKSIGSILYLDLDDFKNVNDEFSHEVGDQVLKVIADRIQTCIRKTDTGARISGDEFVILLEDVRGPENAEIIAKKILDTISTPIQIRNSEAMITGSIGIAMIPQDGSNHAELLQNADTAMYSAKDEGKNAISFFTTRMKDKMLKSISFSKSLHRALENEELFLEFQPQYNTRTGKVFGAEALIRWQHPERGIISPKEFIPVAEKNGMIIPIWEWVIRNVFSLHRRLHTSSLQEIRLAANLSGRQLRDSQIVSTLAGLISESGIDPNLLELEINESSIFENLSQTASILRAIKSMGVKLAIDDFGTGYSSLSYLEKLPFDTLKIDISFVHKISALDVKLPILTGIISIATEMGLDVIAEGVETETQLNFLKNAGCYRIQGRYFKKSLEKHGLLRLLAQQQAICRQVSASKQVLSL
jgi:diguanylate cyclase (GGDEF)-like protein